MEGYKGIQLLERDVENQVEFTTIMWFDTIESVKQFAGENFESAYVLQRLVKFYLALTTHLFTANLYINCIVTNRLNGNTF